MGTWTLSPTSYCWPSPVRSTGGTVWPTASGGERIPPRRGDYGGAAQMLFPTCGTRQNSSRCPCRLEAFISSPPARVGRPRGSAVSQRPHPKRAGVCRRAMDAVRSIRARSGARYAPVDRRHPAVEMDHCSVALFPSRNLGQPSVLHQVPGCLPGEPEWE